MHTLASMLGNEQMLSVRDVAIRLNCSEATVRRMLRAGRLPGIKVGADFRISPMALAGWIQAGGCVRDGGAAKIAAG